MPLSACTLSVITIVIVSESLMSPHQDLAVLGPVSHTLADYIISNAPGQNIYMTLNFLWVHWEEAENCWGFGELNRWDSEQHQLSVWSSHEEMMHKQFDYS
jgi:hypothetical protein